VTTRKEGLCTCFLGDFGFHASGFFFRISVVSEDLMNGIRCFRGNDFFSIEGCLFWLLCV